MSAESREPQLRSGSCLCGAIRYEVLGEPFMTRVCNCNNCRKATGSAFMANGFFKDHQVRVVQGEDKLKSYTDYKTTSGKGMKRFFCGECGSNLLVRPHVTAENENGVGIVVIALGTLDDEVDWTPQGESFPEKRRHFVKIDIQEAKM